MSFKKGQKVRLTHLAGHPTRDEAPIGIVLDGRPRKQEVVGGEDYETVLVELDGLPTPVALDALKAA